MVQPPEGRYHESLWEIAQNHLGDGRRYREIFELNAGRVQPDGSRLTIASLIRPGWILRMPRDAHGPGIRVVTPKLAGEPGRAARPGHATPAPRPRPPVGQPRSPPVLGTMGAGPRPAAPAPRAPVYAYELAAAALLAAGVLAALGRRRREQLWHRAFGRRVAVPDPAAARRRGRCAWVRTSRRSACWTSACATCPRRCHRGRTLPTVFAAHRPDNLDLWVAPADREPPAPWMAVDDGQVWRLPLAAVPGLEPAKVGAPGPRTPGWSRSGPTPPGGCWSTWRPRRG